ncbi:MAG: FtsW/RodA/SpoVE family cell cycle protein [Anaerolineae bacterium]|nr:FtsW/RodA/SpoVE family cell cycle protein [Candidatus Roseilinea sp.]MDW8448736.1 FtsW/RodA/SpoVE family cell cycle protein [Anaerolineae bacterium]
MRERFSSPAMLLVLALMPGWIGATSLALQRDDPTPLLALGVLSVLATIAHLWLDRVAPARDPFLLPVAVMLSGLGLLSIARTAPNFLQRQTLALLVAFAAMLAVAGRRDRLRWLRRFKYTWLIAALALLLASLAFGVNPSGAGARLWLNIGSFFVQPSELLRLLMIAFLAAYFAERAMHRDWRLEINLQSPISNLQSLAPTIAMGLIALAMLAVQQDLGAASLLLITFAFMLYLATGDARLPLGLAGALGIAAITGYFLSARVAQRLSVWLNPWADPQGSAFQVVQSLIALASGGALGRGINQGRPDYVPAVHTDFPFVMIGEELGLAGALAVLAGFAVLILRAWRIGLRAGDRYGMLLAGGIAAGLAVQVFVIVGGNIGLLPLTGVTLPFISYGGTSLVVSYLMVGLLTRLSADAAGAKHTAAPMNGSATSRVRLPAHRAMRLSAGMLAALALGTGYWSIARGAELVARADNPRLVEAELATFRGAIFARDGTLLAYSSCAGAPQPLTPCRERWELREAAESVPHRGATTRYERRYSLPEAAPAVGYYSQRYGVGGLEAFGDATLRGSRTWLDDFLHRPRIGGAITSTLDPNWQRRAAVALRASPTLTVARGAAIVMNWRTGEVLALASAPTFNPNRLEQDWDRLRTDPDAPLVNRATQGLYQPGMLLQWLIETKGAESSIINHQSSFIVHLSSLDLHKPAPFELPNEATPLPATATYSETIGQGQLRVTPLRVAASLAALVAGRPVTPTLIAGPPAGQDDTPINERIAVRPFSGFAQIADNQFVGWHVRVAGDLVIVLALEMPTPDHPVLLEAIAALAGE